MKNEKVYAVHDYFDGPIEGVADYLGEPHKFKCVFDQEKDEYSIVYELQKVSKEEFCLIMKSWEMWLRWNSKTNKTSEEFDSHPVLPNDRADYEKVENELKKLSEAIDPKGFIARGTFTYIGPEQDDFEVQWEIKNDRQNSIDT